MTLDFEFGSAVKIDTYQIQVPVKIKTRMGQNPKAGWLLKSVRINTNIVAENRQTDDHGECDIVFPCHQDVKALLVSVEFDNGKGQASCTTDKRHEIPSVGRKKVAKLEVKNFPVAGANNEHTVIVFFKDKDDALVGESEIEAFSSLGIELKENNGKKIKGPKLKADKNGKAVFRIKTDQKQQQVVLISDTAVQEITLYYS
ncbi:MAG TPA: hypothetical protein PLR18_03425 [bacterium]|nr:hypothetical protein [bacterium]